MPRQKCRLTGTTEFLITIYNCNSDNRWASVQHVSTSVGHLQVFLTVMTFVIVRCTYTVAAVRVVCVYWIVLPVR